MHFLLFPWSINYNPASWCNKSSTHSLLIWFRLNFFFLSLKLWCCVWRHLTASSYINEWRISSKNISRFDIDTTSSWWRSWTSRGACSSWSSTPSSLVISHLFKPLHLSDLIASRPYFWRWTWNCLWRLLRIEDTSIFAWSSVLDVGYAVRFSDYFLIARRTT
jgi:hypothetical protein